jgi:signal transduction histidine kinase
MAGASEVERAMVRDDIMPKTNVVHRSDWMERERIRAGFLAAALCHELKQPLHSLNINVELLGRRLEKAAGDVGVAAPLNALGRAVDRISDCIDAYGVRVLPEPIEASVDVVSVIEQAAERAREAGANITVRVDGPLPEIPGSAVQLGVALEALLDNAMRASRPGAGITMRASRGEDDVQLEVIDSGFGMEPDVLRRAFELGFTTWERDGIGLTITKFIAYHHCGGLSLRSSPADGTVATLVLPQVADSADSE